MDTDKNNLDNSESEWEIVKENVCLVSCPVNEKINTNDMTQRDRDQLSKMILESYLRNSSRENFGCESNLTKDHKNSQLLFQREMDGVKFLGMLEKSITDYNTNAQISKELKRIENYNKEISDEEKDSGYNDYKKSKLKNNQSEKISEDSDYFPSDSIKNSDYDKLSHQESADLNFSNNKDIMARYKKSKNENKYEHSIKTYNPFRKRHARTGTNQRRHKRKGVEYINKTVEAFTQKCYRDLKKELRESKMKQQALIDKDSFLTGRRKNKVTTVSIEKL